MTHLERFKSATKYLKDFGFTLRTLHFLCRYNAARSGALLEIKTNRCARPLWLRKSTSDIGIFEQVMVQREYDVDYGFIPETIVDCGANVGYATVWFKERFPDAKVIAVEPESSNFELLLKNTAGYSDVHPLQAGIWWRNATLAIEDGGEHCGFMVREASPQDKKQLQTIGAVSIADIMERFEMPRIDILKIDIEGSEKEIFSHGFDQWLPKVRILIIELHDRARTGCSMALFKALSEGGNKYSTEVSGENIVLFLKPE